MVEYNMIVNTIWKEKNLNFVHTKNSQKTPNTLPLRASYGMFILSPL